MDPFLLLPSELSVLVMFHASPASVYSASLVCQQVVSHHVYCAELTTILNSGAQFVQTITCGTNILFATWWNLTNVQKGGCLLMLTAKELVCP